MSLMIRAGRPEDAVATGDMLWKFQEAHDWMPKLHTRAECQDFCARLIARGWVIVAIEAGETLGFLARDDAEICAFYVAPMAQERGIGKRLLAAAKERREHVWLKCIQANTRARGFYESQGFREEGRSEGESNDENLPDITYVWEREAPK